MILSLCHDALIMGGGPAGSTLSIALAQAGKHVVLIEKTKEAQHKVCGEFLSPEALPFLRRSGIDPVALGAQTIHSLRIAARDVITEVRLPAPALALTRKKLDEALLARAKDAGVSVLRGYSAEQLTHYADWESHKCWRARITNSANVSMHIDGRDAFIATGKHDLRGWPRTSTQSQKNLVALKMYFTLALEQQAKLSGHVELILYPGGYAGLQPVDDGVANLCVLVDRRKLQAIGSRWEHLLEYMQRYSRHLASRLVGSRQNLDRPLALSSIPYGYHPSQSQNDVSPWRLGDQSAVIPSFCGEGMAIALYTARRAAELYLDGATSSQFQDEVRCCFRRRLYFATLLSRLLVAAPALVHAVRLWPPVLSEIFTATRVPGAVMQPAGR